jgi:pyruvate/2-oxoglutarate dehydrogenase complex dihydrolipoamide dehydrogenase (E3) component
MNAEHFHNLIIGSGAAGKIIAWTLAGQGQKTVVVERSMVGGACPNVACLPSKNVIFSAEASELMAVAQTAMVGGVPYTVLRDTIWTDLTAAEGFLGLFASAPSTPAPESSVSGHCLSAGRPASAVPAIAKE